MQCLCALSLLLAMPVLYVTVLLPVGVITDDDDFLVAMYAGTLCANMMSFNTPTAAYWALTARSSPEHLWWQVVAKLQAASVPIAQGSCAMGHKDGLGYHLTPPTDLFFSRPRSHGWPHHGRTFSIYLCPLSF